MSVLQHTVVGGVGGVISVDLDCGIGRTNVFWLIGSAKCTVQNPPSGLSQHIGGNFVCRF